MHTISYSCLPWPFPKNLDKVFQFVTYIKFSCLFLLFFCFFQTGKLYNKFSENYIQIGMLKWSFLKKLLHTRKLTWGELMLISEKVENENEKECVKG